MPREPLDPRRVPNAERLESASVAGFRAGHENRVAEARVVEAALAQRLPDPPHGRSSLKAGVGSLSGLGRAVVAGAPGASLSLRRGMRVDPTPARTGGSRGNDGGD